MKKKYAWISLLMGIMLLMSACSADKIPKEYQNYMVFKSFQFEAEDETAMREKQKDMFVDALHWYQQIEGDEGVYIAHTEYFDQSILNIWKENKTYAHVPEKPFWYFALSPNYLAEVASIGVEPSLIAKANAGVRVYLLPDTMSEEEQAQMKRYLEESSLYGLDQSSLIDTKFSKDPQFEFATYHHDAPLYTWHSTEGEKETINPVIYLCTSENMRYFENESLLASMNFEDIYLRFRTQEDFEKAYSDEEEDIMAPYHLEFVRVKDFWRR